MKKLSLILHLCLLTPFLLGLFALSATPAWSGSCRCSRTVLVDKGKDKVGSKPLTLGVCLNQTNGIKKDCVHNKQCDDDVCNKTVYPDPTCKPNLYANQCRPQLFDIVSNYVYGDPGSGEHLIYNCTAYRDNSCSLPQGDDNDPSFRYRSCWLQQACIDEKGTWETPQSPECARDGSGYSRCFVKTPPITLQLAIPGVPDKACTGDTSIICTNDSSVCKDKDKGVCRPVVYGGFPGYISAFFKFFVGAMAVISVVMIMWNGFKRIMAAGSSEGIKTANDGIFGALVGLVLTLISFSLLQLINPALVENFELKLDKIKGQQLITWCPKVHPDKPTVTYSCGDQARVNNQKCTGQACSDQAGGCFKVSDLGGVDDSGRSTDYQCGNAWDFCKQIDDVNVNKKFPSATADTTGIIGDHSVFTGACANFSDEDNEGKGGKCLWMENALVSLKDDACTYFSNAYIKAACNGEVFEGKNLSPKPTQCINFNLTINALGQNLIKPEVFGDSWPLCYYDLCNLGCGATWGGGSWQCGRRGQ